MPDTSMKELRQRVRGMEPKVRAVLIQLLARHRPDYTTTELERMDTSWLFQLASWSVPAFNQNIDIKAALAQPPSFMKNVEFIQSHRKNVNNVFDLVPTGPLAMRLLCWQERRSRLLEALERLG